MLSDKQRKLWLLAILSETCGYCPFCLRHVTTVHPVWDMWLLAILSETCDYCPFCLRHVATVHSVWDMWLLSILSETCGYCPSCLSDVWPQQNVSSGYWPSCLRHVAAGHPVWDMWLLAILSETCGYCPFCLRAVNTVVDFIPDFRRRAKSPESHACAPETSLQSADEKCLASRLLCRAL
jgi:hypothetical protein